ncbi:hypothetical protein EBO34_19915 [Alteribacter keqinensis]|uniref:Uncharacterized protein n=1 Tax=Alteribacter keqinensis TaxID=2483800 RepID=A0A3M7TP57_9BACI|nr:hypothetical protein EBO34_19915 [Alteribacter keqinensis]
MSVSSSTSIATQICASKQFAAYSWRTRVAPAGVYAFAAINIFYKKSTMLFNKATSFFNTTLTLTY